MVHSVAALVFFFCAILLAYVYIFYPFLVLLLGSFKKQTHEPRWTHDLPTVTVICAAYNEAPIIRQKVENALFQEYPADRLDLMIVDDDSDDETAEIASGFDSSRVTLLKQPERKGKTAALNRAVENARGEVLVFTDANTLFRPDAVRLLVESFDRQGTMGVVTGSVKYRQHPLALSDEEGIYHDLETRLKEAESNLGTMAGAYGPIYAMPRNLYEPLREDLISDFMMPLLLCKKGYRTIHQPAAVTVENTTSSLAAEFRRKKRIVQRGLHGLAVHPELLNPFATGWLAVQLWSHKVFRWLTPVWLTGLILTSWILQKQIFFRVIFGVLLILFTMGLLGILVRTLGKPPGILRFPSYAIMVLAATVVGWWDWLWGKRHITWEPQR